MIDSNSIEWYDTISSNYIYIQSQSGMESVKKVDILCRVKIGKDRTYLKHWDNINGVGYIND
jgi:hypothetical protein